MTSVEREFVIVGAGVAGLRCAQDLRRAGRDVVVLDKSRGVGGRGATRRIAEQPVDHGPCFVHGDDSAFLDSLRRHVPDADRLEGWPRRIRGEGSPCQPAAFRPKSWRLAIRTGITAYAKSLARGLDVQRRMTVERVRFLEHGPGTAGPSLALEAVAGERRWIARHVVLTPPVPQSLRILEGVPDGSRGERALHALLRQVSYPRCLTLMAAYPASAFDADWDVVYPDSDVVQTICHDSAKRPLSDERVFVIQGQAAWSRRSWDRPRAEWTAELLEHARPFLDGAPASPVRMDVQRWRYARSAEGGDFAGPIVLDRHGARLAFAGDAFGWGGGLQAAWRSGRALAARWLDAAA